MSLFGWLHDPPADRGLRIFDPETGTWPLRPYPEIAELTLRAAAGLRESGVRRGDVVVIIRPSSAEFVADFFGALLLGATPSPVAPPNAARDRTAYLEHVRRVIGLVRPGAIATTPDIGRLLGPAGGEPPWTCPIVTGPAAGNAPLDSPTAPPEIGLLQFSSGSTGRPRGIRISLEALQTHVRTLYRWLNPTSELTYASWLPLHHDMGLVGLLLLPLHCAADLWLMEPAEFVRAPMRWLSCFGPDGPTGTATPTFGLEHLTRRVRPQQLEGVDLSHLQTIIVGAERVEPRAVEAFLTKFAPTGLRRSTIVPAYGLAESTLAVTGVPAGNGFRTHYFDPSSLALGEAVRPTTDHDGAHGLLGCGSALPGVSARVVDEQGAEVKEDVLGEIEISSESLSVGCLTESDGDVPLRNPLRTGDAGFMHDGELFVVGRLGDGIKQLGRWHFAEDVEKTVAALLARPQRTVALLGMLNDRPTVAVLIEGKVADPEGIGRSVAQQSPGMRVMVLSAPSAGFHLTTSGKPQRHSMWRTLTRGGYDKYRVWDSNPIAARPAPSMEHVLQVLRERAGAADRDGAFPVESLAALRAAGLMGLLVPTEYGGAGGTLTDFTETAQQLASACLSTALIWVMHCQQVLTIVRFGTPALRARILPRVAAEGAYLGSVTAERATGGTLLRADESLIAVPAGYRVTRSAPVVTGGAHADGYLLKMRTSPDAPAHDVTMVYLDRTQAEVETGPGWDALGMRGTENVAMTLRGVVPADQIVGGLGNFRQVTVETFAPAAHLGWSACWLGAARAAFSALLREVRTGGRVRLDVRSDLTATRIADIRRRLEVVGSYLHTTLAEVTDLLERGLSLEAPAVQIHLNMLKVIASRETYRAADAMISLAGLSTGYLKDSTIPLERLLRDLRAASLTFDDSRLDVASGALCLLDPAVRTAGTVPGLGAKE
ncbi:hypothetical protein GCM10010172_65770 [Paractinoplanes ferrugineus]|uniref:Acyl-CoA synthetase (AMP-forming)/AMP-acid ligase II n=1 Tax=Paractinoplanes ferrugineus TaxID=113564 RepID=A0A919MMH6_9ACTN|nr:AMP-binding protein [Actinoplanes ferrugineus]GIE13262.1 hypothetical protein Afe05nite_51020 [Actinoplanes ferrugineus]